MIRERQNVPCMHFYFNKKQSVTKWAFKIFNWFYAHFREISTSFSVFLSLFHPYLSRFSSSFSFSHLPLCSSVSTLSSLSIEPTDWPLWFDQIWTNIRKKLCMFSLCEPPLATLISEKHVRFCESSNLSLRLSLGPSLNLCIVEMKIDFTERLIECLTTPTR